MKNFFRARAFAGALLSAMLAVTASRAQAQSAVITGKVTTEFGQPLEGANVYISEMNISVGTNAQGAYTINLSAARVRGQAANLRVRSFGYVPQILPIRITAGTQTHDFSMKQDVNRLAEVVVTGVTAGTEVKNLPFTVAHMDERSMPVPAATNALTQLAGKTPGATIVSASGRPGSTPNVLLRGPKSINGSGRGQDPLYIVDGIELQGSLSDINPQDIESVEVVEGAAASSLYGARAGNGVISITTRSGKNAGSGVHFNFRTEVGTSDIEREYPFSKETMLLEDETHTRFCTVTSSGPCGQTVDFAEETKRVNELGGLASLPPVLFRQDFGISNTPQRPLLRNLYEVNAFPTTYNPIAQMVTPGGVYNNTLDASGTNGGTNFFVSGNNLWQQGSIRSLTGYKRNSIRLNVDQTIGNDWSFGVRTYYARAWQDGANAEQSTGFFSLSRSPAAVDLLAADKFGRTYIRTDPLSEGAQNYSPLYYFQNYREVDLNDRFLGNLTAKYTPTSWLDFDANGSYDRTNSQGRYGYDKGTRFTSVDSRFTGYVNPYSGWGQSYNASVNGAAHKSYGKLNARLTARYLYEQQDSYNESLSGSTLAVAGITTAKDATTGFSINSTNQSIRSIGLMTGLTMDWNTKYFLDMLVRKDGSSLFGSSDRWATYGRASMAYRMSDESWWFLPVVNDFKLRYSYGTAGGRPPFAAQYETYSIGTGGSLTPATQGNPFLRPETTRESEYGFDAEIAHRYGLNFTYAHDVTTDQILPVPLPASQGFSNVWANAGTLDNKTFEGSLNVPLIQQRNLNWSARFNYSSTKTMISQLNEPPFTYGTNYQNSGAVFYAVEGKPYADFYGRKFAKSCSDLPTSFQSQCGASGSAFQKNKDGFIVWVGQGNSLGDGITKNLWNAVLPGSQAPWGAQLNWGMPVKVRDPNTGSSYTDFLGSSLPNYRAGISTTLNYKKWFLYGLLDASVGQMVWNETRQWSLGDFQSNEVDQTGKSVQDAKPIGYYWRQGPADGTSGVGGFYDALGTNNLTVENASYAKIREINVAYNVGSVKGVGDWTIGLVGRNLKTFTNYTGFDPEVGITNAGSTSGSSAINGIDAYNFPNLRTFTLTLSTKF